MNGEGDLEDEYGEGDAILEAEAKLRRRSARRSWMTSAMWLASASVCWLLAIRCAPGSSDVAD